jgi:hypothetical protein
METIILLVFGGCILCGIIAAIIEKIRQPIRDKAAQEALKDFDIQKQKEEVLSINNNFIPEEMKCPKCNGILVHRIGKFGQFWGCVNFPNCHFTKHKL